MSLPAERDRKCAGLDGVDQVWSRNGFVRNSIAALHHLHGHRDVAVCCKKMIGSCLLAATGRAELGPLRPGILTSSGRTNSALRHVGLKKSGQTKSTGIRPTVRNSRLTEVAKLGVVVDNQDRKGSVTHPSTA